MGKSYADGSILFRQSWKCSESIISTISSFQNASNIAVRGKQRFKLKSASWIDGTKREASDRKIAKSLLKKCQYNFFALLACISAVAVYSY